jgi:predicted transcriptional regulator
MGSGEYALENEKRRMIYNHISAYPGVSFNVLKNIFELSDGALRYHLNYLEKNNKINCGVDKGTRCYYPSENVGKVQMKPGEAVEIQRLTPLEERILDSVKYYPGITQKELANRTKLTRFQVSKNIKSLESMNLINKYHSERNVCYEFVPDEELKFKIIKRLVIRLLKNEIDEETFLKLLKALE